MDTSPTPELSQDEALFAAFMACTSLPEILHLVATLDDQALDQLEATASAYAAIADADNRHAITARLADLRRLRSEQGAALAQARTLAGQLAALPEADRLLQAFEAAARPADIMRLVAEAPDDALAALEAAVAARLLVLPPEAVEGMTVRLADLRTWRAAEQAARATLAPLGDDAVQVLANRLVDWIQQPDWETSQAFLAATAGDLLGDSATAVLTLLHLANAGSDEIELHASLHTACRADGIDAAYAQLRQELAAAAAAEAQAKKPFAQAMVEFLTQADDAAAAAMLTSQAGQLLTVEARDLLDRLVEASRTQATPEVQARLEARRALWQDAWQTVTGRQ